MSNLVLSGGIFAWLGDWFYGIWISLWLLIDNVVYVFINWVYRVFMLVAKVDIFGGGEEIVAITRRIYIIVGIAMLFIFAYNLILLIINPEGKQIGNMAKVVQNAIVSIVLVTLLPLLFSYLTTIQNHVLDSNVIGQIILGTSGADSESTNKKAGVKASLDIFSAFYHPEGQSYNSCKSNPGAHELCSTYTDVYDEAYNNDSIYSFIWNEELKDAAKEGKIEYNYLISTIAGLFALWCFISFALDIGVRVAKLALYELISPIPIMMRILPNDKSFDKWFSGITKTYVSLFVRLVIIYFCMYAITLVPGVIDGLRITESDAPLLKALAIVVLILGILQFAKEAPKLISDLFGGSGDIKFGIASKIKDNKLAMGAMGAVGAGVGSMVGNAYNAFKNNKGLGKVGGALTSGLGGFIGGARRGAVGGYKSESFKGLGTGITQAKLDSDYARTQRDIKHKANRAAGAIGGKEYPVVSGVIGSFKNLGGSIKDGAVAAGEWIAGGSASAYRGKAINDFKSKITSFKDGSYYNRGTYSTTQRDAWLEEIRKGGTIKIGSTDYSIARQGSYEAAEKAVKKAIDTHNKAKNVEAYKNNADLVSNDLNTILKSLNDNRAAFGKETEEALAKELKAVVTNVGNRSNAELQKLMTGDNINWSEVTKLLSMKKADIETSSVETRAALYEFTQAAEKGMKRADALNRQMNEKKE